VHTHVCPRCLKKFEHRRFVYQRSWNALERIAARALHRFYGACAPCIRKFMATGFHEDSEILHLRRDADGGWSGAGAAPEVVELEAPGPVVV
jgi:hypothetical protein